jgi:hypothetical protein
MSSLKAQLRAEVAAALMEKHVSTRCSGRPGSTTIEPLSSVGPVSPSAYISDVLKQGERPPSLTSENLLINELFREYLLYNGYRHTEATLMTGMSGRFP